MLQAIAARPPASRLRRRWPSRPGSRPLAAAPATRPRGGTDGRGPQSISVRTPRDEVRTMAIVFVVAALVAAIAAAVVARSPCGDDMLLCRRRAARPSGARLHLQRSGGAHRPGRRGGARHLLVRRAAHGRRGARDAEGEPPQGREAHRARRRRAAGDPGGLLAFLRDLAAYYFAPIGEVMRLALPPLERETARELDGAELFDATAAGSARATVQWVAGDRRASRSRGAPRARPRRSSPTCAPRAREPTAKLEDALGKRARGGEEARGARARRDRGARGAGRPVLRRASARATRRTTRRAAQTAAIERDRRRAARRARGRRSSFTA